MARDSGSAGEANSGQTMRPAAALGTKTLWSTRLEREKQRRDPTFSAGNRDANFLSMAERCGQDVPSKGKKRWGWGGSCSAAKGPLARASLLMPDTGSLGMKG